MQIYDNATSLLAARVWWALSYHGHPRPLVLEGGFAKWVAEGRTTELLEPCPVNASFELQQWHTGCTGDHLTRSLAAETLRDAGKPYDSVSPPCDWSVRRHGCTADQPCIAVHHMIHGQGSVWAVEQALGGSCCLPCLGCLGLPCSTRQASRPARVWRPAQLRRMCWPSSPSESDRGRARERACCWWTPATARSGLAG